MKVDSVPRKIAVGIAAYIFGIPLLFLLLALVTWGLIYGAPIILPILSNIIETTLAIIGCIVVGLALWGLYIALIEPFLRRH